MTPFRHAHVDPRRWAPHGEWVPEGEADAATRMPGFARDFFARLFDEFPALRGGVVFLRWSAQPDDVYAAFDRPPGLAVLIDPHLEYVIVMGPDSRGEHGDWGDNDRTRDALDHVRELLGGRRDSPPPASAPRSPAMRIEHAALWVSDLERVRAFYEAYFGATAGPKYTNAAKGFESYFLTFPSGGARLELMRKADVPASPPGAEHAGWAHLAFSVGSEELVDALTQRLQAAGLQVVDGPRRTGDGYYESVVLDPEGNRVEITA